MSTLDKPHKFPTFASDEAQQFIRELQDRQGGSPGQLIVVDKSDAPIRWQQSRESWDESRLTSYRASVMDLVNGAPAQISQIAGARNAFDLDFADLTYKELKGLPLDLTLSDGFWRYLSVSTLFEVIDWRIPDTGKEGWLSNFGAGDNWSRCYPYKAFLRGHLKYEVELAGYPWINHDDVDFYDSHLFGRRNGRIPSVASALSQIRSSLTSSRKLDPYATIAGKYRSSHVTEILNAEEVASAITQLTEASGVE